MDDSYSRDVEEGDTHQTLHANDRTMSPVKQGNTSGGAGGGAGKDGKRTNRQLVKNAITYTCLAGQVNAKALDTVLSKLAASPAMHFLLLLHDPNDLKFRALYE